MAANILKKVLVLSSYPPPTRSKKSQYTTLDIKIYATKPTKHNKSKYTKT